MQVNLSRPFLVTQAALPRLRAAGWDRIVNLASAVTVPDPPNMTACIASKAGLSPPRAAWPANSAPHEITINAIAPGLTSTETAISTNGANGGFERAIAGQSVPVTKEPVNLVTTPLYVCDEGSGFLTGQTIVVDGSSAKH